MVENNGINCCVLTGFVEIKKKKSTEMREVERSNTNKIHQAYTVMDVSFRIMIIYWVLIPRTGIRYPEMHEGPQSRRSASGPRPERVSVSNFGTKLS